MQKLFQTLAAELVADREALLCTVVKSQGSVPRGPGAMMALLQNGEAVGTIGGGVMEHLAGEKAREALAVRRSFIGSFSVSPPAGGSSPDMGCVWIFFQHCAPSRAPFFEAIASALVDDADVWLALQAGPGDSWRAGLYGMDGQLRFGDPLPVVLESLACRAPLLWETQSDSFFFLNPLVRSGYVYIFGGGHIARELVRVLAHLEFRPVVFEDRPAFAQKRLFPCATKVLLGDFSSFEQTLRLRPQDSIVIMTRGHAADHAVLAQSLRSPAQYIGLIGSRSRMAATRAALLAAGFSEGDIGRIHNPIGLPILAETPAEIAISIAAELIAHRAGQVLFETHLKQGGPMETLYFSKLRPDAVLPSKRAEDAGYDIYIRLEDDALRLDPHETRALPTGIASACSPDYYFQIHERGSSGTQGIGQRCGVIDSGYRGEWFIPVTNHNNLPLYIAKPAARKRLADEVDAGACLLYPAEKAIAQMVLLPVPKTEVREVSYDALCAMASERGGGKLGSSEK
ncbi:MAG: XdhC family protein [Candidatus Pelethousia sp.]|nr:XdhC family protein [Candidatus Pelethousia sp.]